MGTRSTITALSSALALAVMLTAASTPAFAAKTNTNGDTKPPATVDATEKKPKVEQHKPGSVVDLIDTGPKVEQVKPGSIVDAGVVQQQPTFKPDVRVVYLDFDWNGNGKLYLFRVENIGIETANTIGLSSTVRKSSHGGSENVAQIQYGHYAPIASLATGQSQEVVVPCAPQPDWACDSASLSANVDNDLDPKNNGAGSN